jgi:hypothetical protein
LSELYKYKGRDQTLVAAALQLLRKVAIARITKPAHLKTLSRLAYILTKFPEVPNCGFISVAVSGPSRDFGELSTFHYWEIKVDGTTLTFSSGGNFSGPFGSDSFTSMTWDASPGAFPDFYDYRESLRMVPDVKSFAAGIEGISFSESGYSLKTYDDQNPDVEEYSSDDDDQ